MKRMRRLRLGSAIVAVFCLLGACLFYWKSLQESSRPVRVPIPAAELKGSEGRAVEWQVPGRLKARRWFRTGVRVLENGRPLPWRVEALAAAVRPGSFCVQDNALRFLASDDTLPSNNGRQYEFEVHRPQIGPDVTWASLACIAVLLLLPVVPWKTLWGLANHLWQAEVAQLARGQRWAGYALVSAALVLLFSPGSRWAAWRELTVPSEALLQTSEGYFVYHPPRWVRRASARLNTAVIIQGTTPLRRVTLELLKQQPAATGVFAVEDERFCVRPIASDAPAPADLRLRARVFGLGFVSREPAVWWALFLGCVGLMLVPGGRLARARSIAPAEQDAMREPSECCPAPPRSPPQTWRSWWLPVCLVALCKLWVVAGDESIVQASAYTVLEPTTGQWVVAGDNAIGDLGDGWSYVKSAANFVWGGRGSLPSHPAGFPFVASLVAQVGLPWRIAVELFYLGVCVLVASGVLALTRTRLAGFLVFFFLAWHPWTLGGFRDFMSEPLLLVLQVGLLGCMLGLLCKGPARWTWTAFLCLGGLLFLWEWTRHEDPLLYASYVWFALLAVWTGRTQPKLRAGSLKRATLLLVLPLAVTFALGTAVKCINAHRYGVYAKSLIDAPGLRALMKALYHIKPEREIRFAPVTHQALKAACEVSPSLKPYSHALLSTNAAATELGELGTQAPGEFGSFLIWLLPQCLPEDQRVANEIMLKAAAEIECALSRGLLPRRHAVYPLDPNWRLWVPGLPASCLRWFKEGMSMSPAEDLRSSDHRALLQHVADDAASRRTANMRGKKLLLEGVALSPAGTVDSVVLLDERGRWLGASVIGKSNWWEHGQAFDLNIPIEQETGALRLAFYQAGQPVHTAAVALPKLAFNEDGSAVRKAETRGNGISLPGQAGTFSFYANAGIVSPAKAGRLQRWERFLSEQYTGALWLGLLLAGVGAAIGKNWSREQVRTAAGCFLLVLGWFSGRAALFGLLEANMAWGATRYMRCAAPLFVIALALGVVVLAGWLRFRLEPAERETGFEQEQGERATA